MKLFNFQWKFRLKLKKTQNSTPNLNPKTIHYTIIKKQGLNNIQPKTRRI